LIKFFVLNEGSIVGSGDHFQLLQENDYYKNMWEIDLNLSQLNQNKTNSNTNV